MHQRSWIRATGQSWKLAVFYVLVVVALVALLWLVRAVNDPSEVGSLGRIGLAFLGIGAGASALLWLCAAIRCSQCGGRPVGRMIRTLNVDCWLLSIHATDRCPSCGAHAEGEDR
jgi:hypothetical protein